MNNYVISAAAIGYSVSLIESAYLVQLFYSRRPGSICKVWSTITPCLIFFLILASTRSFLLSSSHFVAAEMVLFNTCIVFVTSYYYRPIGLFESINPHWPPARLKFYLVIYAAFTLLAVITKLIFIEEFGSRSFVFGY